MSTVEYLPAHVEDEPSSLVAVSDQCEAIERWAATETSVGALRDASNKLAAIDEYLTRTSTEGRARVAAAMRRLEVRIGELLGPTTPGERHDREPSAATEGLSRHQRHEFRRMAEAQDAVEDVIAKSTDDEPASRRKVMDAIKGAKPRRRAFPDVALAATNDLRKTADRIKRISEDKRLAAHKEQVADQMTHDLSRAIEVCQDLLDRLNQGERT